MLRRCFRRLSMSSMSEEPSVFELRQKLNTLRRNANVQGGNVSGPGAGSNQGAIFETEIRLALTLAQQVGDAESQREALLRGDELWEQLHDPSFPLPTPSQIGVRSALCTMLRRCAMQLKDREAAELWASRFDKKRISVQDFVDKGNHAWQATPSQQATPSNNDASVSSSAANVAQQQRSQQASRRPSTQNAPRMGIAGFDDVDDLDDDVSGAGFQRVVASSSSSASSATGGPFGRSIPKTEGTMPDDEHLNPDERKMQQWRQMVNQQHSNQGGGARRGAPQNNMQRMKEQMMMEDHPYVHAMLRTKPPPGPRWT